MNQENSDKTDWGELIKNTSSFPKTPTFNTSKNLNWKNLMSFSSTPHPPQTSLLPNNIINSKSLKNHSSQNQKPISLPFSNFNAKNLPDIPPPEENQTTNTKKSKKDRVSIGPSSHTPVIQMLGDLAGELPTSILDRLPTSCSGDEWEAWLEERKKRYPRRTRPKEDVSPSHPNLTNETNLSILSFYSDSDDDAPPQEVTSKSTNPTTTHSDNITKPQNLDDTFKSIETTIKIEKPSIEPFVFDPSWCKSYMRGKCNNRSCKYVHDVEARTHFKTHLKEKHSKKPQQKSRCYNPSNNALIAHIDANTKHLPYCPFQSVVNDINKQHRQKHHKTDKYLITPKPSIDLYKKLLADSMAKEQNAILQILRYVQENDFFDK